MKKLIGAEKVEEFADRLRMFFYTFDHIFLRESENADMLARAADELEELVARREGGMIIAMALGRSYDSAVDRAKLEECRALLRLIEARKELRAAVLNAADAEDRHAELFEALFG